MIPGEVIEHRGASRGAHAPSAVGVAEQGDDRLGGGAEIEGIDEDPGDAVLDADRRPRRNDDVGALSSRRQSARTGSLLDSFLTGPE